MPVLASIDEFLEVVHKSNLITRQRLEGEVANLEREGGMPSKPSQLAALLVRRGLLTNFQATQLVNGRWHGFFISGKYKLLEPLGEGGMGKVFLAEHTMLKRLVAIKILPPGKLSDAALVERFYREARAIAALDHPNIVRCHDVDKDQKLHYLVMEYVDGVSLQQLVAQNGPLDPVRAAHYVSQTAAGLEHADEAGWVHRDIKPGNLLVDRQGVVKILDLGLALILSDTHDQLTKQLDDKAVLGTADYLSPEQAMNSHEVDIRADIYSLGATFYFLLCGRPPFADGTVTQKLLWHQVKEPEHIRANRPDLPVPLAAVVHRMMAKEPAQRYQRPQEVVEALVEWTAVSLPPPSEAELPQRSMAIQNLQPASSQGTLSNAGAPTSDVRKPRAVPTGPSSRIRQPDPAPNGTGVSKPASAVPLGSERPPPSLLRAYGIPVTIGVGLVAAVAITWAIWPSTTPSSDSKSIASVPPLVPTPPAKVDPPKVEPPKPAVVTAAAEDAKNHLGKECTIRMQVRLVGTDKERYFLNSEKDYRAPTNFTVVIDMGLGTDLGLTSVDAVRKKYLDQTVDVTGTVIEFGKQKRLQIQLSKPEQMKIVTGS